MGYKPASDPDYSPVIWSDPERSCHPGDGYPRETQDGGRLFRLDLLPRAGSGRTGRDASRSKRPPRPPDSCRPPSTLSPPAVRRRRGSGPDPSAGPGHATRPRERSPDPRPAWSPGHSPSPLAAIRVAGRPPPSAPGSAHDAPPYRGHLGDVAADASLDQTACPGPDQPPLLTPVRVGELAEHLGVEEDKVTRSQWPPPRPGSGSGPTQARRATRHPVHPPTLRGPATPPGFARESRQGRTRWPAPGDQGSMPGEAERRA